MRERGMANYNEFLFVAGQVIVIAGLPLGLLTSEMFSRRRCGSWTLGLGGIVVAITSLIGGHMVTLSAFYIVAQ